MKWFVASDIHGSAFYCRKMFEQFEKEKADRILLLGDLLYHGPRNDLPEEYDPKKVIDMLNQQKDIIYCVRGNCEAEVDQMVLSFPVMAEYCIITEGKNMIYATHGHKYGEKNPPILHSGDVLLCGHTHIPKCEKYDSFVYMNPGSVSIPKENSWHGYMTIEEGQFIWKDLEGKERMKFVSSFLIDHNLV